MLEEAKAKAQNQKIEKEAQRHQSAAMYHRAFVQNTDGAAWMERFATKLMNAPISTDPQTLLQREGMRAVFKDIVDNISYVENEG